MKPKTNGTIQRAQKLKHIQGEGPNWFLIAGGALLSTLSVRIGCMLKQAFETKRSDNANSAIKENGKSAHMRRSGSCQLHSNSYCYTQDEDGCYYCLTGISEGAVEVKQTRTSPMSKEADMSLPLVKVPITESNKVNGGMIWAPSLDRLELPPKPFHHSNSSDSPRVSESGSDIFSKREVIHKLRQQLKKRDEMIMEMQAQVTELQNSLNVQVNHSARLQSQFDSANRDLFDSEREIQRLRKVIADHCVAEVGSPEKHAVAHNWRPEAINGEVNGYLDSVDNFELHRVDMEKVRDGERVGMLKREVGELKEVIEGKSFLIQSYKEQKVELSSKVKELQLRLESHVPNIL